LKSCCVNSGYMVRERALLGLEEVQVQRLDDDVRLVFAKGHALHTRVGHVDTHVLVQMRVPFGVVALPFLAFHSFVNYS
jgi:hypothetical protein